MNYNFDEAIERRGSDSSKWAHYGDDVLPMWVADMDFRSPPAVLKALHTRAEHGVFGYGSYNYGVDSLQLKELIIQRMGIRYGWTVTEEQVLFMPGIVSGLNIVSQAIGEPGDGILINPPVYPPFLSAPTNQKRVVQSAPLAETTASMNGTTHIRYEVDMDRFAAAATKRTQLYLLCSPHNPVGRAFTRAEQLQMAEFCLARDIVICSDEIHSDLLMADATHIPMASLAPEIAERTITFIAPSKTFNQPGLYFSVAIIPNSELRQQFLDAKLGIVPSANLFGYAATHAAYSQCQDWLDQLLGYLTANRNYAIDYINRYMPQIRTTVPEATYLLWLDCRDAGIAGNPQHFFVEKAQVAFNDGTAFGKEGEGFVRLNYGCPRATLTQALEQMRKALTDM